ncbi:MAG: hypothetical protein L0271_19725 [Gemmatimonadetes bacterium]|nr:hypothetical protein [Gemmatimonadota bacterium]
MNPEKQRGRMLLVWPALIVLAFGGGAGWQFTKVQAAREETREAQRQLAEQESELIKHRTEGVLAAATIAAQLGSFERSRQFTSDFFTMLQSRTDSLPAETRSALAQILEGRDAMITALSRNEAGAALELARLFVRYRRATGGDPGIIELRSGEPGMGGEG